VSRPTKLQPSPEDLSALVKSTRRDAHWIAEQMPRKALTKGQLALQKKHGTPYEFAKACIEAIGEISILEANQASEKYRREWEAA